MKDNELYIDLYHEDRKVVFLERRLKEIPIALKELVSDGGRALDAKEARRAEIAELEASARRQERELELQRTQLERLTKRQKQVTSVEAMEAGERDISRLAESIEEIELDVLGKLESLEVMARQDQLRQPGEESDSEDLGRESRDLKQELQECERELVAANAARDQLINQLGERECRRYQRFFKGFGNTVLAALNHEACGFCGEKMPPQQAMDVRTGGAIASCQGCGRLVIQVKE
ncbi:MAG: hypothetical protein GY835_06090 [bacterium]|nr:hypothetical protein [bacterium]